MSFWQSTYTLESIKILKDAGMKAVVLRAGYANSEDTLLSTLVSYCDELDIPFGLYWYLYPEDNYQNQIDKFVSVIKKYPDTKNAVLDFEEYKMPSLSNILSIDIGGSRLGSNYEKHMDALHKKGLAVTTTKLSANYSTKYLSAFYKNSHDALKKALTIPIMDYSAKWCIDGYFPEVASWLKPEFYWNAAYVKYYLWYQDFITSLGGSWGSSDKLISISNLSIIMAEVEKHWDEQPLPLGIDGCIAWQFNSFFPFEELTKGQRNIDANLAPSSTFKKYFDLDLEGGEPLPEIESDIIDMVGVSQIGYGADKHHNDCGLAASSADVLAAKGIFVPVDQWYEMDGWDAPIDDSGTYAYQLQKALALFEVRSNIGHSLSIQNIKDYIGRKLPIITLVNYKVLSDAGLTYYKGDFLHWFVVIGYDKDNVIVLDSYRPYESGLQITIPNQIFLSSYKGTYVVLVDSIKEGGTPMAYNGTVLANLNVRSSPNPEATRVGGLNSGDRVEVDLSTITSDNWGNVKSSNSSRQDYRPGWVSLFYVKLDSVIPDPPPTGDIDESAIRKDELSRAKAAFDAYFTERDAKL